MPTRPQPPDCPFCKGHGTIVVHSYSIDTEIRRLWKKAAARMNPTPSQAYCIDCPQCHGRAVDWITGANGGLLE